MARYRITAPDGNAYEITGPENATQEELIGAVQQHISQQKAATETAGLGEALKGGFKQFGRTVGTGIVGAFAPEEAAQRFLKETKEEPIKQATSLEAVKQKYLESGFFPAAGEALSQIPGAIAEQVPNIGAMAAGARLGAMAGSAVAPGIGTVIGGGLGAAAAPLLQAFGSNIGRQAEEQRAAIEAGATPEISRGAAAAAALPQAALDVAAQRLVFGKQLVAKVLGRTPEEIAKLEGKALVAAERKAEKIAKEGLAKTAARGVAAGTIGEVPTEVAQQMLERAQAGLPLFDDKAKDEYFEAAYGAALVSPLGAVGSVSERGAAREGVAGREAQRQLAEQQLTQLATGVGGVGENYAAQQALLSQYDTLNKTRAELKERKVELEKAGDRVGLLDVDEQLDALDEQEKQLQEQSKELNVPLTPSPAYAGPQTIEAEIAQLEKQYNKAKTVEDRAKLRDQLRAAYARLDQLTAPEEVPTAEGFTAPEPKKRGKKGAKAAAAEGEVAEAGAEVVEEPVTEVAPPLVGPVLPKPYTPEYGEMLVKRLQDIETETQRPKGVGMQAEKNRQANLFGSFNTLLEDARNLEFSKTDEELAEDQKDAALNDLKTIEDRLNTLKGRFIDSATEEIRLAREEAGVAPISDKELSDVTDKLDQLLTEIANRTATPNFNKRQGEAVDPEQERFNFSVAERRRLIEQYGLDERIDQQLALLTREINKKSQQAAKLGSVAPSQRTTRTEALAERNAGEIRRVNAEIDSLYKDRADLLLNNLRAQLARIKNEAAYGAAPRPGLEEAAAGAKAKVAQRAKEEEAREAAKPVVSPVEKPIPLEVTEEDKAAVEAAKKEVDDAVAELRATPQFKQFTKAGKDVSTAEEKLRQFVQEFQPRIDAKKSEIASLKSRREKLSKALQPTAQRKQTTEGAALQKAGRELRVLQDQFKNEFDTRRAEIAVLEQTRESLRKALPKENLTKISNLRAKLGETRSKPGQRLKATKGARTAEQLGKTAERETATREERGADQRRLQTLLSPSAKTSAQVALDNINETLTRGYLLDPKRKLGTRGQIKVLKALKKRKAALEKKVEEERVVKAPESGKAGMSPLAEAKRVTRLALAEEIKKVRKILFSKTAMPKEKAKARATLKDLRSKIKKGAISYEAAVPKLMLAGKKLAELKNEGRQLRSVLSYQAELAVKRRDIIDRAAEARKEGRREDAAEIERDHSLEELKKREGEINQILAANKAVGEEVAKLTKETAEAKKNIISSVDGETLAEIDAERAAKVDSIRKYKDSLAKQGLLFDKQLSAAEVKELEAELKQVRESIDLIETAPTERAAALVRSRKALYARQMPTAKVEQLQAQLDGITTQIRDLEQAPATEKEMEEIAKAEGKRKRISRMAQAIAQSEVPEPVDELEELKAKEKTAKNQREIPGTKVKGTFELAAANEGFTPGLTGAFPSVTLNTDGPLYVGTPTNPVFNTSSKVEKFNINPERNEHTFVFVNNKGVKAVLDIAPSSIQARVGNKTYNVYDGDMSGLGFVAKLASLPNVPEFKSKPKEERAELITTHIFNKLGIPIEALQHFNVVHNYVRAEIAGTPDAKKIAENNKKVQQFYSKTFGPTKTTVKAPAKKQASSKVAAKDTAQVIEEMTELTDFDAADIIGENIGEDFSLKPDGTVYRRGAAETPVDKAEADALAAKVKVPKGVKFEYAYTYDALPDSVKAQLKDDGATKGAVLPDGTVVVIGNAHSNTADIQKTIAHEVVGHYGVDMLLGPKGMKDLTDRTMRMQGGIQKLAESFGKDVGEATLSTAIYYQRMADQARVEGNEKRAKELEELGKIQAMRELIAHVEETRPTAGFLQKANRFIKELVGYVRAALRKMGLLSYDKVSTSDIYKLLRDARKAVGAQSGGVYVSPTGEIAFRKEAATYSASVNEAARRASGIVGSNRAGIRDVLGSNLGLQFVTKFVDRFAPLERVAAFMKDSAQATQMMYFLRMHDQGIAWTQAALTKGPLKIERDAKGYLMIKAVDGANVKDMVEALKDAKVGNPEATKRLFTAYLLAERAEIVGYDKLKSDIGSDLASKQDLKAALDLGRSNAAFQKAKKIYNDHNNGLLDFLVETGAMSKEAAQNLRNKSYVPYYREDKDGNVEMVLGGEKPVSVGNIKNQPYLHELVGGNSRIIDVFASSIQNTRLLTDMGLRNLATRNAAFGLQSAGMLKDNRINDGSGPAAKDVIRFKIDGEEKHAVVDSDKAGIPSELLVSGMEGVRVMMPLMVRMLSAPAGILRKFITRNPVYAMRQLVRDSTTNYFLTGADVKPVGSAAANLYKMYSNKKDGSMPDLQSRGIISGNVLTGTSEQMEDILLNMVSGKPGWEQYMAKLDILAQRADEASRISIYNDFRKQGLSDMEATMATLESMNFNKRGTSPSIFMLNAMVPFLNAQIQGLNVLQKSLRGTMPFAERLKQRKKLVNRAMFMVATTAAYALMMSDDEAYENSDPVDRYNNWFVRVPGLDEPVRVPIPFEVGLLFKAVPEAMIDAMRDDAKAEQAYEGMKRLFANSMPIGPSSLPAGIKPIIELTLGSSFYTGLPIESEREKQLLPEYRTREKTTEISKAIGSLIGVSPIQLDYLINGYFSGTGLALAGMGNFILRSPDAPQPAEKTLSEMPVIGSLFQTNTGSGYVNTFYRQANQIEQAKATFDALVKKGDADGALKVVESSANNIAIAGFVEGMKQQLADIREAEKLIRNSDIDPKEKAKTIKDLRISAAQLAKSANLSVSALQ